jgi:hypothetical protein
VGTSAGAYAGSTLTSGHFKHLLHVFDFFGEFPRLFAKLAPITSPNLSQKRAQEINFNVKDGSSASIRAIGHAALAADNHLNGDEQGAYKGSGIDMPMAVSSQRCFTSQCARLSAAFRRTPRRT